MPLLLVKVVKDANAAGIPQELVDLAYILGFQGIDGLCVFFWLNDAYGTFGLIDMNLGKEVGLVMFMHQKYLFYELVHG